MGTHACDNKMQYVFHTVMRMKEPLHIHTQNRDCIANTVEDETIVCLNNLHNNLYMHVFRNPNNSVHEFS